MEQRRDHRPALRTGGSRTAALWPGAGKAGVRTMASADEHVCKAREWLRRDAVGFDPGDGVTCYQYALAECAEAITALKATHGVTDATLARWLDEIVTQEQCSARAETVIARVEDYVG